MVLTKLEERPLQEIAHITGGSDIAAGDHSLPLGTLFRQRLANRPVPLGENVSLANRRIPGSSGRLSSF